MHIHCDIYAQIDNPRSGVEFRLYIKLLCVEISSISVWFRCGSRYNFIQNPASESKNKDKIIKYPIERGFKEKHNNFESVQEGCEMQ